MIYLMIYLIFFLLISSTQENDRAAAEYKLKLQEAEQKRQEMEKEIQRQLDGDLS
jgi:hypothetical protein